QGGSAPQRLFLSGGASIMPYTAQFFAEKLNVPVEYFNPLRNVQIDPAINLEELARVAHSLGEVIGLGLRNLAHCPVELNLMPESTLKWQAFNQKKPYFIATVFSLVAVVAAMANEAFRRRYALDGARSQIPAAPTPDAAPPEQGGGGIPVPKKKGSTNEVDTIDITFKAVTLVAVSPSANNELAYAVRNELRN